MSLVIEILLLVSLLIITVYLLYLNPATLFLLLNVILLLVIFSFLSGFPVIVKLIFWLPVLGILLLFFLPGLRKNYISKRLLNASRRNLENFFGKESVLLDQEITEWEAESFSTNASWDFFNTVIPAKLSAEEQSFIDGPVTELCAMLPDSTSGQLSNDLPIEVFELIQAYKFFGLYAPREYGGLGFSARACSSITMKIASRSVAAAIIVMTPNFIGPGRLLIEHGTKQQCDDYLPRIFSGAQLTSFAWSELDHGNHSAGWQADGVVAYEEFNGKETLGIKLTWEVPCTTLLTSETLLGLAFDLHDPEHILAENKHVGITLALIPGDIPGVRINTSDMALDMPLANGLTQGHEVFIPIEWVLGGQTKTGQAGPMLRHSQAVCDAILLPALSTARAKYMARNASAFARVRDPFSLAKDNYASTYQWLGRIGGNTFMLDAIRWVSACSIDSDLMMQCATSAMTKVHLAARMRMVSEDTTMVDGNSRLCTGSFQQVDSLDNILPVIARSESTNKLPKKTKSLLFVVMQLHPCFAQEMQAMMDANEQRSIDKFDRYFWRHVRQFGTHTGRSIILGLSNSRIASVPVTTNVGRHYQRLSRLSANFAFITDYLLLRVNNALKNKPLLFASLLDMAGYLYMASTSLERYRLDGEEETARHLVAWAMQECEHGFHLGMHEILHNLSAPFRASILRLIIYPFGAPLNTSQDQSHDDIAAAMMNDMAIRGMLTDGIYLSDNPDAAEQKLENALQWLIKAAPLEKLVKRATRLGKIKQYDLEQAVAAAVITDLEAEVIRNAKVARQKIFSTDESALG